MAEITFESFKATLDALLDSNPHARSKGNKFKEWCETNFGCGSRISHIREQRQTTNRVSEQFRYFDPIVVFVCDKKVKRDELERYILERTYKKLATVAIIGMEPGKKSSNEKYSYTFEKLLVFKKTGFASWAEPHFSIVEDAKGANNQDGDDSADLSDGYQVIYFGAPGTGKSFQLRKDTNSIPHIRTIFHPDTDYSSFVGCYKPIPLNGGISYDYQPQAFTKAYVKAWLSDKPYCLIIEEINRGNCAQVFGDVFQLLDRTGGVSDYEIEPDADLRDYLKKTFAKQESKDIIARLNLDIPEEILSGEVMRLPSNLYLRATMNTSDQSLFPMDSAFKRRWAWKFFSIKDEGKGYKIVVDSSHQYDWWKTIEVLNGKIYSVTKSADKQLGYWFAKLPDGEAEIEAKDFVSKVVFYLWNDVFKDYSFDSKNAFSEDLQFDKFYTSDGHVETDSIIKFMQRNGITNELAE